jgi:hypothetical protein
MARSRIGSLAVLALPAAALCGAPVDQTLPGGYCAAIEEGVARGPARLDAESRAKLRDIEQTVGWRHFLLAIQAAAVLYTGIAPKTVRRAI